VRKRCDAPPGPIARPFEDIDIQTDPVVVGDSTITVYHGTPALNRLVARAFSRFPRTFHALSTLVVGHDEVRPGGVSVSGRPTTYRAYLLRVWTPAAGQVVRASLRDVGSGETHAFADLDSLDEWLRRDTEFALATTSSNRERRVR